MSPPGFNSGAGSVDYDAPVDCRHKVKENLSGKIFNILSVFISLSFQTKFTCVCVLSPVS